MAIRFVKDPDQPDAILRTKPPKDQHGEPMQSGRRYLVDNDRKLCFEDPETGELYYQSITRLGVIKEKNGVPVPPVAVLSMPVGDYTVHRLEGEA